MTENDIDAPNDERPLSPAEMLALVSDQQRSVEGQKGSFVPFILLAWGIAWTVGFGVLWLSLDGLGEALRVPGVVAIPLFAGLLIAAVIVSTVLSIRSNRGRRGGHDGAFAGIVYGQAWWVGSIALWLWGQGMVANGMDAELLRIFYPSGYIFFAGVMYIAAAAIWRAVPMLVLGAWSVIISAVAPFFGQPTHYLIYALAGGGAFLVASAVTAVWTRNARRRVARITA